MAPSAADRLAARRVAMLPGAARPTAAALRATPRMVHLGLGAFARAHAFDYTARAAATRGDDGYGIVAIAPRSRNVVAALRAQDLLYGVLVRGEHDDAVHIPGIVRAAHCAADEPAAAVAALADPATRVVTLTVTEAGYHVDAGTRQLRQDAPAIAADVAALAAGDPPRTAPGLLLAGLAERRRRDAGPVALVSCDNMAGNGEVLAAAVLGLAERRGDLTLVDWLRASVRFPDTVVDRITPATTTEDRVAAARLLGMTDEALVVAEPYRQWVIQDDFPAGRPAWHAAGAVLVDDVTGYAAAKLRILNAGHSLLAHLGLLVGRTTVADAMADDVLAAVVARYLRDEAAPALADAPGGPDPESYVDDVLARWRHPRMAHRLAQIAVDGTAKLPERISPTIRARGSAAPLARLALAAWCTVVLTGVAAGRAPVDPRAPELVTAARAREPVPALLAVLSPELAADHDLVADVARQVTGLRTDPVSQLRDMAS